MDLPTFRDVRAAALRLTGDVVETPMLRSERIDQMAGREVWVKAECLQNTGSFKYRGAINRILTLSADQLANGLVAYSSGNHAQGVALASLRQGICCLIVMPQDTPKVKVDGVKAYGGEVFFYDRLHEQREIIAQKIARQREAFLIAPYEDRQVIAGQGSVGMEIAKYSKKHNLDLQSVITNAGGGGLTAGIALALQEELPDCDIFTCEPENFDDHRRSFSSGIREKNHMLEGSICDALMAQTPGEMTFAINKDRVAGGLMVSDGEVLAAMRAAFFHLKLVLEPGGAASLAAVINGKAPGNGPVCVVATGGNVDSDMFQQAIEAKAQ